ncbi:hypothetical protein WH47_04011 [Habropoda laboriosa]|uniref:Uncharacterized protein n=1 Tax=Habropoda laboriosa TaxID=597456 RepID=A0A0L7QUD4_9HYME|nr:hypothetical protein WH47_04011 [Habropoda laboriosa]
MYCAFTRCWLVSVYVLTLFHPVMPESWAVGESSYKVYNSDARIVGRGRKQLPPL